MKRNSRAASQPRIVSVELKPQDKRRLDAICDDRGMTIKAILDRLVRWFATMPEARQTRLLRNQHSSNSERAALRRRVKRD
jgi:hypothetical protein